MQYSDNVFLTQRRKTHEVKVGEVGIGGSNPIRVQSMTNTNTMDTEATLIQVTQLAEAGCEIVRITAPSVKEAENLGVIKAKLTENGINVPLVADIHFTPNAALVAAEHVDKVRVNPGNFSEKKKGSMTLFTDTEYQAELERIEEKFRPLVIKCRELGKAIRIGTNHGSLSERIMNRFGDTPEGMVESAMEFVYFAEAQNFNQIVLSMKSSNPQVMMHAYRMLVARLYKENRTYPIHLGVTEAGGGTEGRIKSASGMFNLLYDGVGDTVRVSLTEDPVREIPVAKELVAMVSKSIAQQQESGKTKLFADAAANAKLDSERSYFSWQKDTLNLFTGLAEARALVEYKCRGNSFDALDADLKSIELSSKDKKPDIIWLPMDFGVEIGALKATFPDYKFGQFYHPEAAIDALDVIALEPGTPMLDKHRELLKTKWIKYNLRFRNTGDMTLEQIKAELLAQINQVDLFAGEGKLIIAIEAQNDVGTVRFMHSVISECIGRVPISLSYATTEKDINKAAVHAAGFYGALLLDGIGDSLLIRSQLAPASEMNIAYQVLQAARLRITQTEYISCPSCGRTLFDLEETTASIQARTNHLKGLKIGVMGCIVNGPGEMADADFGYVGAGKDKINLYVGHELVKKNIPTENAVSELIDLIKAHDRWVEPE
jgi:(E)-4-hydroxy-3-methylbut-2-enyl-diphosphate synthase